MTRWLSLWTLGAGSLGSNPSPTTHLLCDLEEVTWPPCASVSTSIKWGDEKTKGV